MTRVTTAHRRPPAAVLLGLPVLAAILGAVLALTVRDRAGDESGSGKATAAARVVAVGDLRLTLPDGWTPARRGRALPGLDGAGTRFVRGWNTDIAIAQLPPANLWLLPADLVRGRRADGFTRLVRRAGRVSAYHYFDVLGTGSDRVVDVYAAPTTRGVATIACSGWAPVMGECDLALLGLSLARGSFMPVNADAAFVERLPAVISKLNGERLRLRARLARAATAEGGARAARGLAAVYGVAADALRPLIAPQTQAASTTRLLERLRATHAALAETLRAGNWAAFAPTARTIGAYEARLSRHLATFNVCNAC
jgi:hypothetical protein